MKVEIEVTHATDGAVIIMTTHEHLVGTAPWGDEYETETMSVFVSREEALELGLKLLSSALTPGMLDTVKTLIRSQK